MSSNGGYAVLGVQVPAALNERLESVAKQQFTNKSSIIRRALDEYISEHE